ncbi:hypothetical protein CF327_g7502 [Tilletia walkeri]|uniref:Uncharacterized protein n=1 Tax=Tilletia walkeri TaxID=117179 RepID=A0A8X7T1I0_9BASI|nr:hypothetical protein CF327_g7502 [Tilletia walkeri]KAE8262905.1 hypothetical protein A4X09_0g7361 [Tilletia walkeri]
MRKLMLSAGSTGDALSAAAQRLEGLAQRSALLQSLAPRPRMTIGGAQKPASFWQVQSSGQNGGHDIQSTPMRLITGVSLRVVECRIEAAMDMPMMTAILQRNTIVLDRTCIHRA